MNEYETLRAYLKENILEMISGSSSGEGMSLPNYELFPEDYLLYAEQELEIVENDPSDIRSKINCILHLKRALDCQLDLFFYIFGFSKIINDRGLGFNKKIWFLQNTDVVRSKVIDRFNTLRNRVEHHYQIPKIEDIEIYYDFISSLISNIEMMISSLNSRSVMQISDLEDSRILNVEYFRIPNPKLMFYVIEDRKEIIKTEVEIDNFNEFTKYFRIFVLLSKRDIILSKKTIAEKL